MRWEKVNVHLHNVNGVIVYRGSEEILTAEEIKCGQYDNIEFCRPEFQKCNKTRQKAIAVLVS